MRHLYRKKANIVFPVAGVLAAVSIFGACATSAWATPTSGKSVTGNIVVREEAVDGAQVGSLSDGQEVTITGETTGSDGKKWYSVIFEVNGNERDGWVRADLIDATESEAQDEEDEEDEAETADADEDTGAEVTDEDPDTSETGEGEDTDTAASGTVRMELTNGYVDLSDVPDDVAAGVGDRFVVSVCTLANGTVSGYQLATADALVSNDAILTNYYYLYGTNDIGESGWYVYDASQGSIQKSILEMSYSLTATEEDDVAVQETESDTLQRMIVAVLGLVCVLLLILTIVFSIRYRRLRSMLEREERLEERKTRQKKAENPDLEKDAPSKQSSGPVEIMDLDDMDDADYETLLGQYREEHMPPEEDWRPDEDDNTSEDVDNRPLQEEMVESDSTSSKDDNNDSDGEDDLEFL